MFSLLILSFLSFAHDGADRRTEEMSQGTTSLHRWNPLSRQTAQEDFLVSGSTVTPLRSVSYTFSSAGDRTGMASSDPAVGSWTYQYTKNHQLAKLQHLPSKESHSWKYTRGMLPSVHKMPNGAKETRTYDSKERLARLQTLNGKNVVCDISYTFNKVDLRKTLIYHHLGDAVLSLDYDGAYRLVHEQLSGGTVPAYDLCYVFDGAGNRVAKFSGNSVVYSVFDVENRLTQETTAVPTVAASTVSVDSTTPGFSASAINDGDTSDSVLPTQTWASQPTSGQHFATLDLGSTAVVVGRVKCFIPTAVGPIQRFKAQYFDANAAAFVDLPGPHVSGASPVGNTGWFTNTQVAVSTTQVRFLMDDGGGPASSSNQAYLNEFQALRIDQGSTKTLNYDPSGLLLGESDGTTYGYDWGYRLASYQKGTASATYLTDVNGRRLSKTTSGGTELYAYDGEDVIADYSQVGSTLTLKARYTNGLGIDEKLTMSRAGASYDFVPDALGSTQALVGKKGNVANRYFNDAWGNSVQKVEGVANRYQYAGREFDAESGNYHNRARFYMPGRGAFGQRDPSFSGENWHAYVSDDPVDYADPYGLILALPGETITAKHLIYRDLTSGNAALKANLDYAISLPPPPVVFGSWEELLAASAMPSFQQRVWERRRNAEAAAPLDVPGKAQQQLIQQPVSILRAGTVGVGREVGTSLATAYVVGPLLGKVLRPVIGVVWSTGAKLFGRFAGAETTTAESLATAMEARNVLDAEGKTTVYRSVEGGVTKYVGITDDMVARAAAHLREKGIVIDGIPGLSGLSRSDARGIEQALIEFHGLGKNGGTLINKINSIAESNPVYAESVKRGYDLLRQVGYPGLE